MNKNIDITFNEYEEEYISRYNNIIDFVFRGIPGVVGALFVLEYALTTSLNPGLSCLLVALLIPWFVGCVALSSFVMHKVIEKRTNDVIKKRNLINHGWIYCSERLPEEYGEYLCCNKNGELIVGYPTAKALDDGFYVETDSEGLDFVIAWQPLPSHYMK